MRWSQHAEVDPYPQLAQVVAYGLKSLMLPCDLAQFSWRAVVWFDLNRWPA